MKQLNYIVTLILFIVCIAVFTDSMWKAPIENSEESLIPVKPERIIPLEYKELFSEYTSFIEAEIDTTNNVGAAVAVVCGDSVVFIRPFGVKKAGTEDSVNIHTVFRMASVSKGFAGVLAAKLEQGAQLDLDEKVRSYLPELSLKDSASVEDLKIKHILNHTSGLVPHAYDNLVEAHIPMSEIIGRLNEVDIAAKPGEVYGYQNAIYSLIDTVLRTKNHKSYSEYLEDELFQPLGMKDASTDYESMVKNNNVAFPHVNTKKGPAALKPNKRYYTMVPAAGVNASISDMSIWLQALLGYYPEVIDSNVQNIIATPTIQTPLKRRYTWRWKGIEEKYYSLGWRIFTFRGYNIVYHGGYVKGYRAEISFCPSLNAGVVFLQNSPNRISSQSMPKFWEMYFEQFVNDSTLAEL